jgi:universal stress protein E
LVIGSVTEKAIREVPCSFITLKSEDLITLQLETNIRDIENHYNAGKQLMEDGFFEESIEQFKLCLSINNMHVPSLYGIAKVYDKLNEPEKANLYRKQGREIMDRIWDQKIEADARKYRGY